MFHMRHNLFRMEHLNQRAAAGILRISAEKQIPIDHIATSAGLTVESLNRRLSSQTDFRLSELGLIADALDADLTSLIGAAQHAVSA